VSRWTRRKCQRCARVRKLDVGVAGRQPRIWAHRLGEPLCLARLLCSAAAIRTNIIINHHDTTIHAPAPMMATVNKYIHDVSQENYYRQHLISSHTLPHRCHFLLFMTVVTACLTTTPALSTSRFESPLVTHTFRAGWGRHSFKRSLGVAPSARGMALRRVMRTPFARAYCR
jgi:hypothetical protein